MVPILLVSKDPKKIKNFIKPIKEKYEISNNSVFIIEPEKKEISINQIRDIKRNLIYAVNEHRLYVLKEFDKSSYEAQNSFLKTLEEHNDLIHFILVVSQYYNLTPTILSRSRIIIEDDQITALKKETEDELKILIRNKNLGIISNKTFQIKLRKKPIEIFDEMISFFKNILATDENASNVLKEILIYRYYVINNHADAQNAVDHLLIFIYLSYKKNTNSVIS